MTISQACKKLGAANEHQLAKALDTNYQTIQYWRRTMKSVLPSIWADRVRLRAMGIK